MTVSHSIVSVLLVSCQVPVPRRDPAQSLFRVQRKKEVTRKGKVRREKERVKVNEKEEERENKRDSEQERKSGMPAHPQHVPPSTL